MLSTYDAGDGVGSDTMLPTGEVNGVWEPVLMSELYWGVLVFG